MLGHGHIVKISSPLLLYSGAWIRRTKYRYIVMVTQEISTKFHDPRRRSSYPRAWAYKSLWRKCIIFFSIYIYSMFIAIVLRNNNSAFLCHCWFLFILWRDCWYAKMTVKHDVFLNIRTAWNVVIMVNSILTPAFTLFSFPEFLG